LILFISKLDNAMILIFQVYRIIDPVDKVRPVLIQEIEHVQGPLLKAPRREKMLEEGIEPSRSLGVLADRGE